MIIWGSKARKTKGKTGDFFCPACKQDRQYTTIKWDKYFTLYFIPLFPTQNLATVIQCQSCAGEFKPMVLAHTREQILSAVSPWECQACKNKNVPERNACVSCGQPRSAQGAAAGA